MRDNKRIQRIKKRRKRAIKIRLFISLAFLIALFLIIKTKSDREETISNQPSQPVQVENSEEKDGFENEINSSTIEKKDDKSDEEVFSEILKTENVFKGTTRRNEMLNNLEIYAKYNKNAKLVMKNADAIHPSLLKLSANNYTAVNFVAKIIDNSIQNNYSYPEKVNDSNVNMYLQWDKRWGYEKYAGGIIGYTGCGPISSAMIISTLKHDKSITPAKIAQESQRNGFYSEEGTNWEFYPYIATKYGLRATQMSVNYNVIKSNIKKGNLILISVRPGDFTQGGHVMVISGVDKNGDIILNDPNSLLNSKKPWKYKRLEPQIKTMWVFSNGE